jgi:hypothetical protein
MPYAVVVQINYNKLNPTEILLVCPFLDSFRCFCAPPHTHTQRCKQKTQQCIIAPEIAPDMLPAISWLTERPVRAYDLLPQAIRQMERDGHGFGSAVFTNFFLAMRSNARQVEPSYIHTAHLEQKYPSNCS